MTFQAKAASAVLFAATTLASPSAGANEKLASADTGATLSGGEIRALFPGQFEAVWKDNSQVSIEASSDGGVHGRTGILSDSGSWSVRGDELCVTFYWWTGNEPRCTEVRREGGWYVGMMRSNGEPRVRFRRQ